MFRQINRSRGKFYLANAVTCGIYGAIYVMLQAGPVGERLGSNLPDTRMGVLLTVLTLGIYPGIMLSVLAYKVAPAVHPPLGHTVLALNLASLLTALLSGGLFMIVSVALWTHAAWLVADASAVVLTENAPNHQLRATPGT